MTEPPTFRGQSAAEAASLADLPWWEVFDDPVAQGPDPGGARQQLRPAHRGGARPAGARPGRRARARTSSRSSATTSTSPRSRKALGRVLGIPPRRPQTPRQFLLGGAHRAWEIDIWGRIRRSNEAAQANLLATEDFRRGVLLSLVSDVAQAYFELLELDVQLEIARDSDRGVPGHLRAVPGSPTSSASPPSCRRRARRGRPRRRRQATIPELESQIVAKENQISMLLGKAPGADSARRAAVRSAGGADGAAGLPSALLERRPDLRQAEQQLVAAPTRRSASPRRSSFPSSA